MWSIAGTAIASVIALSAGAVSGWIFERRRQRCRLLTSPKNGTSQQLGPHANRQLNMLAETVLSLTSQVGKHVGEHTERVNDITRSLQTEQEVGNSPLNATTSLISVNQKLQSDLHEAELELRRQREKVREYTAQSLADALTGLANRRSFDLELSRVSSCYAQKGQPFSLVAIDIDHFKRVNDEYGHMIGDRLLKEFSLRLKNVSQDGDFLARYGGEEFIVILSKSRLLEAAMTAERMRAEIANRPFKIADSQINLTVSMGVKQAELTETEAELISRADLALLTAKASGRNRIYIHDGAQCIPFNSFVTIASSESADPVVGVADDNQPLMPLPRPAPSGAAKPTPEPVFH